MVDLERELLEKIKKDDDKAFSLLFQNTYIQLCTFATDYLRKAEIAEEVVQDVFLKFWVSRKDLHITSSLKSYLYKMVQNYSLNYIRDHSTRKFIKEELLEDIDLSNPSFKIKITDSVFEKILSDQIEHDLSEALANLPEQCREIFTLCRFEGLSYSEIAQQLNISVSTVKTQMGRAMEKLHFAMKKHL
jgi:RNA polymerase sigma-70 factor (ECF subfamily)